MTETTQMIPIDDLRIDRTQSRASTYWETVDEYAEAMKDGVEFPPLVVFLVDGEEFHVADGIHRCIAADKVGIEKLPCIVHTGTLRDAIRYSLTANVKHGLRRTNPDKRHAVGLVLDDPEWCELPSREIADMVGVSHNFVNDIRNERKPKPKQAGSVIGLQDEPPKPALNLHAESAPDDEPANVNQIELEMEKAEQAAKPKLLKSGTELVSTHVRVEALKLVDQLYKKLQQLGLAPSVSKGKGKLEVEIAMETVERAIKEVGDIDDDDSEGWGAPTAAPTATPMQNAA